MTIVMRALACASLLALGACATVPPAPTEVSRETRIRSEAQALLGRMTLEAKIGQLVMPDISTITPTDVATYRFGTILNGGNSGPGGNDKAAAGEWLKAADAYYDAAMQPLPGNQPVIPMLWATDGVHGHNNIPGATLFPHNVGLGAAGDADLVRRIGEATAREIAATGIDWTFAPTLAVAQDTRWGRSYESYSSDPALVTRLGTAMVEGLQGREGTADFLSPTHVVATIKHYFGDGGTGGKDQGDTVGDLTAIEAVHGAPYPPAIRAGAQSVMASFNSINGVKMHGNKPLLTDLLRGPMGFRGVTVGDWNGHGQIPGCTNTNCPQAMLAGLDIYMAPEEWKGLYASLLQQARDGTLPMARIDEAVLRLLEVKLRAGAFAKPRPSARPLGGHFDELGAPAHRAIAREAVAKSLVLLKNDGVLPLKASATVLVAGKGADSLPMQAGGWTVTWQGGGDLTNADLPGATSIGAGIAAAMRAGGGRATISASGAYDDKPDVAVVVFGEQPYAEFLGDRLDHRLEDEEGLALLRRYRAAGIRTVAVLLSGRPLWTNRELAAADAFVAAWLPGSEGAGVADVLVGTATGAPRADFTGRLPFDWPSDCAAGAPALLPRGAGGRYAARPILPRLAPACATVPGAPAARALFERGLVRAAVFSAEEPGATVPLPKLAGQSTSGALKVRAVDIAAQEDGRALDWNAPASLIVKLGPPPVGPAGSLELAFSVSRKAAAAVRVSGGALSVDLGSTLALAQDKGLRTARVPLACLSATPLDTIRLSSEGALGLRLQAIKISPEPGPASCQGPF